MNYSLIFIYPVDNDVAVYLYNTESEVMTALREAYTVMRLECEYGSAFISDDGRHAEVHQDDGTVCSIRIGVVYQ